MTDPGAATSSTPSFPHVTILLLGIVTISAYGAWYYSFGVLLQPILTDTGWPESSLAATFSVAAAFGALASFPAGRFVDRHGSRSGFLLAAALAVVGLGGASYAPSLWGFAAGAVVGGAALQSLTFYHVTQATAVRSAPAHPSKAIARLTIYGAFSSTIFLPAAAYLESVFGWRGALRSLVGATALVLVLAALVIADRPDPGRLRPPLRFAAVVGTAAAQRFVVSSALIGLGVGMVLVYQVPLMTAAGLSVGVAAWMAGARGIAQVSGRLPLAHIVARLGARGSLRLAYVMITLGMVVLGFAGNVWLALVYVAAAGFGIGATSPLQGIYADELFDRDQLSAAMGAVSMVFGLAGAFGPALAGLLNELTGTRWWSVGAATLACAGAAVVIGGTGVRAPTGAAMAHDGEAGGG